MNRQQKRLIPNGTTILRTQIDEQAIGYVVTTLFGRTEVSNMNGRFQATFIDLAGSAYQIKGDVAPKLSFEAVHDFWLTDGARELPTTTADRDYRGYDFLTVWNGRLVAIKESVDDAIDIWEYEQYLHLAQANDFSVLFSGSVDHAKGFTKNADVIALCNRIRG